MNKIKDKIIEFYKSKKDLIIITLFLILIINVCSVDNKINNTPNKDSNYNEVKHTDTTTSQNGLEIGRIDAPNYSKEPNSFNDILLIAIIILTFIVLKRKGILDKFITRLIPKVFIIRVNHFKSKKNNHHLIRIRLLNKKDNDITFNNPIIVFENKDNTRKFNITNVNGNNIFPLTLIPDTSEDFTIDLEMFFNYYPELRKYNHVYIMISNALGSFYKSKKCNIHKPKKSSIIIK